MRTSLALICALVFFASPYFFVCLEAERLSGWPESVYRWFGPWLPPVMVLVTVLIIFVLPEILALFDDKRY